MASAKWSENRVTTFLPEDLYEFIMAAARQRNCTVAQLMRNIISDFLVRSEG